jgi:hypothetical protein
MKNAEKGNGIKLNLGKIDDADQTFFNGKLVGQTGLYLLAMKPNGMKGGLIQF